MQVVATARGGVASKGRRAVDVDGAGIAQEPAAVSAVSFVGFLCMIRLDRYIHKGQMPTLEEDAASHGRPVAAKHRALLHDVETRETEVVAMLETLLVMTMEEAGGEGGGSS